MARHVVTKCPECGHSITQCLKNTYLTRCCVVHSPWTGSFKRVRKEQHDIFVRDLYSLIVKLTSEEIGYWEVWEMKRKARSGQREKGSYEQHTEDFFKKFPAICQILWDCWYEDGTARELGKLSIGLVPDGVNLAITDPSERLSAFCTAATLKDALRLLEDAISGPGDPWRPWPKSFGKKGG